MIKPEIVNRLKSIHELQLLLYLSKLDEWKHTRESRRLLSDSLSIAGITIKVALRRLRAEGLISRASKGIYKINKVCLE